MRFQSSCDIGSCLIATQEGTMHRCWMLSTGRLTYHTLLTLTQKERSTCEEDSTTNVLSQDVIVIASIRSHTHTGVGPKCIRILAPLSPNRLD